MRSRYGRVFWIRRCVLDMRSDLDTRGVLYTRMRLRHASPGAVARRSTRINRGSLRASGCRYGWGRRQISHRNSFDDLPRNLLFLEGTLRSFCEKCSTVESEVMRGGFYQRRRVRSARVRYEGFESLSRSVSCSCLSPNRHCFLILQGE